MQPLSQEVPSTRTKNSRGVEPLHPLELLIMDPSGRSPSEIDQISSTLRYYTATHACVRRPCALACHGITLYVPAAPPSPSIKLNVTGHHRLPRLPTEIKAVLTLFMHDTGSREQVSCNWHARQVDSISSIIEPDTPLIDFKHFEHTPHIKCQTTPCDPHSRNHPG
jgi:hypothetical protein